MALNSPDMFRCSRLDPPNSLTRPTEGVSAILDVEQRGLFASQSGLNPGRDRGFLPGRVKALPLAIVTKRRRRNGRGRPRRTGRQLTAWREAPEEPQTHARLPAPHQPEANRSPLGATTIKRPRPVKRVFHKSLANSMPNGYAKTNQSASSGRRRHGDVVTTPCRDGLP
jgi:hypothetical protein